MAAARNIQALFPRAHAYRALLTAPAAALVRERDPAEEFAFSERHLKCAWFDDAVRPAALQTEQGAEVTVEFPGRWNLEAGPDFLGAALRVGPERRRLTGDVEIHIHPADWRRHGHGSDPAYARVAAHVTWFSGRLPASDLPPGCAQISLQAALAANPLFSFENLDVTAYPFAQRVAATPCARILKTWTPEDLAALFEAAGEDRLRRKAARLAPAIKEKGPDQVLYEELMSALGYKHNRAPFRRLAEICPLATLREESGRNVTSAYALLLGIAGLLPAQTESRWDDETRVFVRQLWNRWWKLQSRWSQACLSPANWRLGGLRPPNHPRRRLMAAAFLFTQQLPPAEYLRTLAPESPPAWLEQVLAWLQPNAGTYWRNRLALGGRRQAAEVSLTGETRAAASLTNVILPFLAAGAGSDQAFAFPGQELLSQLPPEEDNSLVRQTAAYLLGPDHNPRLYRTGLRQQGLIQIFHDFCLNDRSHCAGCLLLNNLESFRLKV
jgi:hypothetical protein